MVGLVKSVDGLAESMSKVNSKVAEDIRNLTASLDSSIKVLKAQTAAAQKSSADPLLKDKIYWLALDQAVAPTNEPALKMNFVGIGFEAYFNPLFPSFFKCTYTDAKNNKVGTRHDALADSPHPPSALGWAGCLWRVAWHGELRTWMPGRERGHGCGASGKVPGGMASRLRRTCCEPRRCAPCRVRGGRKGR